MASLSEKIMSTSGSAISTPDTQWLTERWWWERIQTKIDDIQSLLQLTAYLQWNLEAMPQLKNKIKSTLNKVNAYLQWKLEAMPQLKKKHYSNKVNAANNLPNILKICNPSQTQNTSSR